MKYVEGSAESSVLENSKDIIEKRSKLDLEQADGSTPSIARVSFERSRISSLLDLGFHLV